jgi:hypothetical protein
MGPVEITGTVRKEQILDNCLCHSSVGENVVKHPSISIQVVKKQRNMYVFTAYLETSIANRTLSITQGQRQLSKICSFLTVPVAPVYGVSSVLKDTANLSPK